MVNNTNKDSNENTTKRKGLIRQERVIPNLPVDEKNKINNDSLQEDNPKQQAMSTKKANINQQRNIKTSIDTKKQIDILLKFSNHKFTYELIDSMIDVYVEHALDHDQKRAFKTLSKLISE